MVFSELLTILRREVIADNDLTLYSDTADLYPALYRASANLGALLGIPRLTGSQALIVGANSFVPPADCLDVRPGQMIFSRVWQLTQRSYRFVLGKQLYPNGYPEYYHFDPTSVPPVITFAPATNAAGLMEFEYVARIDPSTLLPTSQVWGGAYANFQHIVTREAGIYLFTTAEEYDKAQYWKTRSNEEIAQFARVLGHTATEVDVLMARLEQARSNNGSN